MLNNAQLPLFYGNVCCTGFREEAYLLMKGLIPAGPLQPYRDQQAPEGTQDIKGVLGALH